MDGKHTLHDLTSGHEVSISGKPEWIGDAGGGKN